MSVTLFRFPGYRGRMVGTTRARTAGLAFLFVLGLILHGAAAEFSLHQRDFPSSPRDGWTASAVMTPALPPAARTQLLRNGVGPWTGTAHSDGAPLASVP